MRQVVESAPAAKRGRAALVQTHECAPVLVQTTSVKRKRERGFRVKNTPRFKFAREYKCEHGKRRRDCRKCGGSSLCTHGTPKTRFLSVVYWPVCGPVLLLCESGCVLVCACASGHIVCVGAPPSGSLSLSVSLSGSLALSLMENRCKLCGGSALCPCGRRKTLCPEARCIRNCHGKSLICQHKKIRRLCTDCKQAKTGSPCLFVEPVARLPSFKINMQLGTHHHCTNNSAWPAANTHAPKLHHPHTHSCRRPECHGSHSHPDQDCRD